MKTLLACMAITAGIVYLSHVHGDKPAPVPPPAVVPVVDTTSIILQRLAYAIATIESRHNVNARRYESHLFERRTGQRAETLTEAMRIDRRAALLCTSFGKYQILGSNYRACGFATVDDMAKASEQEQDVAFVRFAIRGGLVKHAARKQWDKVARIYNGKGYRRNRYAQKLASIMERG